MDALDRYESRSTGDTVRIPDVLDGHEALRAVGATHPAPRGRVDLSDDDLCELLGVDPASGLRAAIGRGDEVEALAVLSWSASDEPAERTSTARPARVDS